MLQGGTHELTCTEAHTITCDNSSQKTQIRMSTEGIIFTAIVSVIIAADIAGNTLVILVVKKYRAMKTPMNYLLLSLASSDLLVGSFFIDIQDCLRPAFQPPVRNPRRGALQDPNLRQHGLGGFVCVRLSSCVRGGGTILRGCPSS